VAEPTIRAVERTLAIIRLLAEETRPLSIAEVSKGTALAPATVHRMLATLMKEDWVEQNPRTSRYRLGLGLLGTAAASLAYTPLVGKARATLLRVSQLAGLYSWLGVLVGRRIAYLAQVEGTASAHSTYLHAPFQPGVGQYAHATCGGKVLLAALSRTERQRLYRGRNQLERYTDKTITYPERLEEELEEVRARGYALDPGELREAWHGIAVPVHAADGRVIAAIVTGGIDIPLEKVEALVPEVRFLSQELTLELGIDE
jgi:DNA-binding IclR family transcriptional regulator